MNCRSSVASANESMRSWSTASQDETPISWPTRARISSRLANGMRPICSRVNKTQSERRERRRNLGSAHQLHLCLPQLTDQAEQDRRAVLRTSIIVERLVVISEFEADPAGTYPRGDAADQLAGCLCRNGLGSELGNVRELVRRRLDADGEVKRHPPR